VLNVKLLLALFAETGVNIQVTGNGQEAVEELQRKHYDIILMDMQMPVMDGYQATVFIREELKHPIPIIAITAHAMTGEKEKCLSLGMNDYVPKPVNADLLFEKICTLTNITARKKSSASPIFQGNVEKLINLSYLIDTLGIKKKPIQEMLDDFVDQMAEDFPLLSNAVSQSDYVTIENLSHKLKSPASMLGISKMEKVLLNMELQAASNDGIEI
jgi:CheY-like chemotaxis protein